MPFTVETYYNIAEKRDRLRGIYDEYGENAVFIVPAGLDKDALLDLICGGTPYFPLHGCASSTRQTII